MKGIEDLRKIAVLGAGTMGHGIAQVLVQAGFEVVLYDLEERLCEEGKRRIEVMLEKGKTLGKVSEEDMRSALSRISTTASLDEACLGAGAVIEAAPERMEIKKEIFGRVEELVDRDCLLATNTSSLSVSEIAKDLVAPERFVGLHYFNPPPLMKLLEIVRGERSSPRILDLAREFALRQGKEPILVRDSPGFASSRLGLALGLEAVRMVEEGVASPSDIDKAMKLGYRHPMGPLELTDLVGLDVRLSIARYLSAELDEARFAPPRLLEDLVAKGRLGRKVGRGFYEWKDGRPVEGSGGLP